MTDGSLDFGQRKDVLHQLRHFGACEIFDLRGKALNRAEMTELMEYIFSLSEVQRAVRHMAITHINQASRGKELKADGTISSERHAD